MNKTRKQYLDSCDRLELRPISAVSTQESPRTSAQLHPILSSQRSESSYLIQWLQSGGNLDFVVLALCSCVLTVLCHQATLSLPTPVKGSTPTGTQPAAVDFAIKAGLFTHSKLQDAEQEA